MTRQTLEWIIASFIVAAMVLAIGIFVRQVDRKNAANARSTRMLQYEALDEYRRFIVEEQGR